MKYFCKLRAFKSSRSRSTFCPIGRGFFFAFFFFRWRRTIKRLSNVAGISQEVNSLLLPPPPPFPLPPLFLPAGTWKAAKFKGARKSRGSGRKRRSCGGGWEYYRKRSSGECASSGRNIKKMKTKKKTQSRGAVRSESRRTRSPTRQVSSHEEKYKCRKRQCSETGFTNFMGKLKFQA